MRLPGPKQVRDLLDVLRGVPFHAWIAGLATGALLLFSFPQADIGVLAWVALVPLILVSRTLPPQQAFFVGYLAGFLFFTLGLSWISHSMIRFGGIHPIAAGAAVCLLGAYLALYPAVFAALLRLLGRRFPRWLVAPLLWMTLEFIRAWALTGFPWLSLGYTQHRSVLFRQGADLVGVYGLSGAIVLVNGALAELLQRRREPRQGAIPAGVVIVITLGMALYGWPRSAPVPTDQRETISAAIIQGNIAQDEKWDAAFRMSIQQTYFGMTRAAAREGAGVAVWPEAALPSRYRPDTFFSRSVSRRIDEMNLTVVLGTTADINGSIYNGALLVDGDGQTSRIYGKSHLVPFGEYVPLPSILFWVDKLVYDPAEFTVGTDLRPLRDGDVGYGTFICYEVIFPNIIRQITGLGADVLVNVTNEAWFGRTAAAPQMMAMATLRAVENRRPVIRSANTGISAFIDAHGFVIVETKLEERARISADVVIDHTETTLFTRWGNWLPTVSLIVVALLLGLEIFVLQGSDEAEAEVGGEGHAG